MGIKKRFCEKCGTELIFKQRCSDNWFDESITLMFCQSCQDFYFLNQSIISFNKISKKLEQIGAFENKSLLKYIDSLEKKKQNLINDIDVLKLQIKSKDDLMKSGHVMDALKKAYDTGYQDGYEKKDKNFPI